MKEKIQEQIDFWKEEAKEFYKISRIKGTEGDEMNMWAFKGIADGIGFVIRSLEVILKEEKDFDSSQIDT